MAIYDAPESLHVGNGVETVFGFNWPYLLPRDLIVTVNGQPVPTVLASPNQVAVTPAPASLAIVRIYRNTPAQNPTYLFATGIPMLPKYIDGNNKQLLYALQEGLLQFAQTQATADAALEAARLAQVAAEQAAASAAQQAANIRKTVRAVDTDLAPLPAVAARAGTVMGFDAAGNPVAVVPASGSAAELALALADPTDPDKGLGMLGHARTKVPVARKANTLLSSQWFSLWEFEYAIPAAARISALDPSTWDWSYAFEEAFKHTQGAVLYAPPYIKYRLGRMVRVPVNSLTWTTVEGSPNLTTLVLDPTVPTAFCYNTAVKGDTIRRIAIGGFVVDASKTGGTDGAVVFGGRQGRVEIPGLNYADIHLYDLKAYGMSSDTSAGNFRVGIQMSSIFSAVTDTPCSMQRIYVDRVRLEGGITGMYCGAGGIPGSNLAPLWMDEFHITDFYHDTLLDNAGYPAAGIQLGQDATGGRVRVTRAWCARGGDVGVEINGFYDQVCTDVVLDRPGTGFWAYNYHALDRPWEQSVIWDRCRVIKPRNNPGWRIGRTRGGRYLLKDCSMDVDDKCDPRVLDFAASSLVGLDSVTIQNFTVNIDTSANATYLNLASCLSLGLNTPEWTLNIDGFHARYRGEAPRASHECATLVFNSLAATSTVNVNIRRLRVSDKRSGTLLASDAIRVYGSAKLVGVIEDIVVDSTVGATQARHGLFVAASSVPAPEVLFRNPDFRGCTTLFEVTTAAGLGQRQNIRFADPRFADQQDTITRPFTAPAPVGVSTYQNTKGQPVRVSVYGGTVSELAVSQDGVTYYSLGMTSGTFVLAPNETLRTTCTVAPSLRIFVLTRLTV